MSRRLLCVVLLLLSSASVALAEPTAMMRFLKSNGETAKSFSVGEPLIVEIIIDGSEPDQVWTLAEYHTEKWIEHGPLLLNYFSLEDPDQRKNKIRVQALALEEGTVEVPPIGIRPEGTDAKIEAASNQLQINSVLTQKDQKPVWILPPVPVFGRNKPLLYTLYALTFLLIATIGLLMWRRIRSRMPVAAAPDPKKEYEQRLADIERKIRKEDLNEKNWKQISYAITFSIKRYCSDRLEQNFMDNTDGEFIDNMRRTGLEHSDLKVLERAFNSTNEVRYGRKPFDKQVALDIVAEMRRLPAFEFADLERTKPDLRQPGVRA